MVFRRQRLPTPDFYRGVAATGAGEVAAGEFGFDEDGELAADEGAVVVVPQLCFELDEPLDAFGFDLRSNLVRHFGGGGSFTGAEGEMVNFGEAAVAGDA